MDRLKVLLVDDEEEFVKTLCERLQMRNIHPDVAFTGLQALESVQGCQPDVMVLDLNMPGLNGMEVLKQVKAAYPHIQVAILTGHGSAQEEIEAMNLGALAYMHKPANLEDLLALFNQVCQGKREKEPLEVGKFAFQKR